MGPERITDSSPCAECGQHHFGLRHGQWLLVLDMVKDEEIARLHELLLKHGDHMPACDLWLNSGSTCSCGWDAVERELAGEGKEVTTT